VNTLAGYHTLQPTSPFGRGPFFVKQGMRGYREGDKAVGLLLHKANLGGSHLLDATGTAGAVAFFGRGLFEQATVLEASRASLRCAEQTFADDPAVTIKAGTLWDLPAAGSEVVCALPSTDKGSLRVQAELASVCRALAEGGEAFLVMHKDQGAKRYQRVVEALFDDVEVLAKEAGWRLLRARKCSPDTEIDPWLSFTVEGLPLQSLPGVFSAGKLDPGSALLWQVAREMPTLGRRVLDLGCGYGLLAVRAALGGALVTALDDDLSAVHSTRRSAELNRCDLEVRHSDVDSSLGAEEFFDTVLMNPPFHVGKKVRLELPQAFIAAARERLKPGGLLLLVANRALPYEKLLNDWQATEIVAGSHAFKVLRAVR
jgi:16S rRNA (guanine1207-N2)-methyltransferase